ncbi:Protein kinase-like protein [Penicillium mononematosum]|uniref:Protein kinase-like protein n=1 Tax=Penicillium mononematosum TaxID=268346 RepID=UPI00254665E0|nr:Protein kinase-like protein [Penicillium mononematosum]KAJ6183878.1 Protein kinase-like protein [Penicillium mononematosum]
MNIHVSPSTRAITGMVDWRDATVGPFGLSFWGLETLLGTLGADGWHFHARHLDLRSTFWEILYATAGIVTESQKQAVRVGRMVGIFQAYSLSKGVPVETGNLSLSVLEEVLSYLSAGSPSFGYEWMLQSILTSTIVETVSI